MNVKADPKKPWKAVVSGLVTLGTSLGFALSDDRVTKPEIAGIAVAVVVAVAGVYGIKNPQVVK